VSGPGWFVAGIAVGAVHGLTLWWTVRGLQPGAIRRAVLLVWGGALLRSVAVAGVLWMAVTDALTSGLAAAVGFSLARLAWSARIGRGTAPGATLVVRQE
jgi:F1F0 ATPase subunit 2